MSTRCNVRVRLSRESTVILYRHCDGYPSATGADLVRIIQSATAGKNPRHWDHAELVLRALMDAKQSDGMDADTVASYQRMGWSLDRPQYELTTRTHDDIEWRYTLSFTSRGTRIVVDERTDAWTEFGQCGKEPYWRKHVFTTFEAFVAFVRKHEEQEAARMAAYNARHGGN